MAKARGRGIDFEHRFNTSRWAEDLLLSGLNALGGEYVCIRLGLSQTSGDGVSLLDDKAVKEPDLLVFRTRDLTREERSRLLATDLTRLTASQICADVGLKKLVRRAVMAIEVEFSPYKASEMKGRHWQKRTPQALARKVPKHANPPTAPNIWVKLEDLPRLRAWQAWFEVPVWIVHVFDQEAFATDLDNIARAETTWASLATADQQVVQQLTTGIFRKVQTYDRVDAQGAAERKIVYVVTPAAAMQAGDVSEVEVSAQLGLGASKKYIAHVLFKHGRLTIAPTFLETLNKLPSR